MDAKPGLALVEWNFLYFLLSYHLEYTENRSSDQSSDFATKKPLPVQTVRNRQLRNFGHWIRSPHQLISRLVHAWRRSQESDLTLTTVRTPLPSLGNWSGTCWSSSPTRRIGNDVLSTSMSYITECPHIIKRVSGDSRSLKPNSSLVSKIEDQLQHWIQNAKNSHFWQKMPATL